MVDDDSRDGSPRLRGTRVLLRPISMDDVEWYVRHQDGEMADRFEWPGPASVEDVRAAVGRWVAAWAAGGPEWNFAIVDPASGQMIGDCELEQRSDGFVDVMYVVFAQWRHRGVATHAVRLLVEHAADVLPGQPLLFRIHPDNEASQRVARAAGAERQGAERSATGRVLERWVASPAWTLAPRARARRC